MNWGGLKEWGTKSLKGTFDKTGYPKASELKKFPHLPTA